MMKKSIDIITIAFKPELDILKSQASSIDLYCKDLGINKIMIVINDDDLSVDDIDSAWWGSMQDRVFVVHRNHWPVMYGANGWVTQQALKLMSSTLSLSSYSMVLDAKTIFVVPVTYDSFFTDKHKLRFGQIRHDPVFDPSRRIVQDLFDINLPTQLGPGGVPFILDNSIVREMINWIEKSTNMNFIQWFEQQGMLTEFLLYAGWVVKKYHSLDHVADRQNTFGQVLNINNRETSAFDHKYKSMLQAVTVSIHRDAWKLLTTAQQQQYTQFLSDRHITLYVGQP